jgi:hypothetical protein
MKRPIRLLIILTISFFSFDIMVSANDNITIRAFFDSHEQKVNVSNRLRALNDDIGAFGIYEAQINDIAWLDSMSLRYEIILTPAPGHPLTAELDSFYYTYNEMVDSLYSWQSRFPALARVEIIGQTQQENRNIYAIKISDSVSVDEDEPVLLFDGAHHACEIMGMEICLALADTLLDNYGSDSNITSIINGAETWIVPLINPDGNSAVHAGISLNYRKNGRDHDNDGNLYEYECNNSWTCSTEGVDLNRNYDWYWNSGGSNIPMNYYYRGASAGSESENAAITALVARIRPVFSVTYHSWGEVLYYPWTWSDDTHTPDHDVVFAVATAMAGHIERENEMGYYDPTPTDGRGGLSPNWQYARYGVISFLPETVAYPDFIPETEARKNSVEAANLQGIFYLYERISGGQINGKVYDIHTRQPLQAEVRILERYSTLVDPRTSDSLYGRFTRILQPGIYTIQAMHPDYPVKTIPNVVVTSNAPTIVNIPLGVLLAGDINGNGRRNGADLVFLVAYLKGIGRIPEPLEIGDVNGDCLVNVGDAVFLVLYFKGGAEPMLCNPGF